MIQINPTKTKKSQKSAILSAVSLFALSTVPTFAQETSQKIRLAPLDEILVVASARDAQKHAGAAQFISSDDLATFEYADINRVLRQVPGVNMQEEDGYGLRPNIGLRGTGLDRSAKIVIMEDGILAAPAPYAAPSAYYFPHTARMENIEVVKGSAAIKYGPQTTGGAINLLSTAIPETSEGNLSVLLGSDNQQQIHGSWGTTYTGLESVDVGVLFETYQDQSDGFKDLDGGGDTGFDLEDYVAKIRLSTKNSDTPQTLELKLQYSDEESNETYLGLTEADFAANPERRYRASADDVMNAEHKTYSLSHSIEFDKATLTTVAYRTEFGRNWYKLNKVVDPTQGKTSISSILADPITYAGAFDIIRGASGLVSADDALEIKANNRDYEATGIQSMVSTLFDTGSFSHDFEFGVRYHEDEMDRYQWVDGYRMDNGDLVLTSAGTPGTESNRIDSAKAWAFFAQDEITYGNWTVTPGLRFESIKLKREDYGKADPSRTGASLTIKENKVDVLIPGLGITYQATDEILLLAGVHKGFTNPNPGSTAKEEESINYELGARYLGDQITLEAIGFYNDYDNLVGSCTNSTGGNCVIGDQFDGGKVKSYGLELTASTDLGEAMNWKVSVPVSAAYTYTKAEFDNAFDSSFDPWGTVEDGDALPYIPEHQLNARIGVEGDTWRTSLNANYVGNTRASAGQGDIPSSDKVGARLVLDASGEVDISENVSFFASVDNITDTTYVAARRPAGLRPGKPRSFLAGLKVRF